jgi:hypothetical protein
VLAEASLDGYLAGWVLTQVRREDIAEEDFLDGFWLDAGTLDSTWRELVCERLRKSAEMMAYP